MINEPLGEEMDTILVKGGLWDQVSFNFLKEWRKQCIFASDECY